MPEVRLDHVQIAASGEREAAAGRYFDDALAERSAAAGSPVTWDEALPGERRFYSEDPWGNRIEFLASAAS